MEELRCKNCDAGIDVRRAVGGVVKCSFCGSVFTLPKPEQDSRVLSQLGIGQNELDCCAFDRAYTAFSKAAELDSSEPEAHFGMALADFKVQYLRDRVNNKLQPVCHEINGKTFSDSSDYPRALSLATPAQKKEYTRKAEEIDYIRREFFALSKSGAAYDCFICVKVTGEDGRPTSDSADAGKIYNALRKSGYKPFYSEFDIGTRTGADYEAMILYALYVARRMLIVCYNEEYLKTRWVKNEYTRFVSMIADEQKEKNSITFVFRGKPVERLPGVRGKIQGIDFGSFDALDKIRAFIDGAAGKTTPEVAPDARPEPKQPEIPDSLKKMFEEFLAAQQEEQRKQTRLLEQQERERQAQQAALQARREQEERAAAKHPAPVSAPAPTNAAESKPEFVIQLGKIVSGYNGEGGRVVIPNNIVNVYGFATCAARDKITSVILPEGVRSIGPRAFANCRNLQSVTLPRSLQIIDGNAFADCVSLKSISLPGGLTDLRTGAFAGSGITSVTVPSAITKLERGIFKNCKSLASVSLPGGLKKIESEAFYGCGSLRKVSLPAGVEFIEEGAFKNGVAEVRIDRDFWFWKFQDPNRRKAVFGEASFDFF